MAFKIIEGFDLYAGTTAPLGLFGTWLNASSGSIAIVSGRFAGQAVQLSDGTGNTSAIRRTLDSAITAFSIGFAFRHNSLDNVGTQPIVRFLDTAVADQLSMYINGATGQIIVYRGLGSSVAISSGVGAIANQVWHHIELVGTIDNSGTLELFIDGISQGTFSGDTQQTANVGAQFLQLQAPDGSGSGNQSWWDDIYLTDTAVRVGEMRVDSLRVNSDGAEQDFNPSPSSDAYQAIDDSTVSSSDYIQAGTVGDTSYFGVTDLVATPEAIKAVQVTAFARKTDASTRQFKLLARVDGVESTSGDQTLTATYQRFAEAFETVPGGGVWDAVAVNDLEIGVRVTT